MDIHAIAPVGRPDDILHQRQPRSCLLVVDLDRSTATGLIASRRRTSPVQRTFYLFGRKPQLLGGKSASKIGSITSFIAI